MTSPAYRPASKPLIVLPPPDCPADPLDALEQFLRAWAESHGYWLTTCTEEDLETWVLSPKEE